MKTNAFALQSTRASPKTESYLKWTAQCFTAGLVWKEKRRKGWVSLVGSYLRGQISSKVAGWEVGGSQGGVATDGLFTKGSGASGRLYIYPVSCPGFSTGDNMEREEWSLNVDTLCWVQRDIVYYYFFQNGVHYICHGHV